MFNSLKIKKLKKTHTLKMYLKPVKKKKKIFGFHW